MKFLKIAAFAYISLTLPQSIQAADYSADQAEFITQLVEKKGFGVEQLQQWLAKAKKQQSIIDAMNRPAEGKAWHQYRPIFLTNKRTNQGVDFWKKYEKQLQQAEEEFQVPANIIVAIIGVETFYGRIKGSYRVLDALYTLGFHYPKRGKFFRNELAEYFTLAKQQQWQPELAKGSYAGAMGYGQFIPSSYLAYAVDFDKDGKVDLINNPVDAIGSVANYFSKHGWKMGEPVIVKASISNWETTRLAGRSTKLKYSVAELAKKGVTLEEKLADNTQISLLKFEQKDKNEYRVGLNNFYVISRYNRSPMYSLAVHQLSQKIKEAFSKNKLIAQK